MRARAVLGGIMLLAMPAVTATAGSATAAPPPPELLSEPPLKPTDRNVPEWLLSPQVDLLILAGLAWWVWRVHRRRGQEEARISRTGRPGRRLRIPVPRSSSEAGRFRSRWADQFKRIRYAELRRDLSPVRSLMSPGILARLEVEAHRVAEMRPDDARVIVSGAQVVERWSEEDGERVVVRFVGRLQRAPEGGERQFEELWTFRAQDPAGEVWIVTEIERGELRRAAGDGG